MKWFKMYECVGNCKILGKEISNPTMCQLIPMLLLFVTMMILILGAEWIYTHICYHTPM